MIVEPKGSEKVLAWAAWGAMGGGGALGVALALRLAVEAAEQGNWEAFFQAFLEGGSLLFFGIGMAQFLINVAERHARRRLAPVDVRPRMAERVLAFAGGLIGWSCTVFSVMVALGVAGQEWEEQRWHALANAAWLGGSIMWLGYSVHLLCLLIVNRSLRRNEKSP